MSRTINAKDGYEYDEIPIEDVQPGDVARCNGREFPVIVTGFQCGWIVQPKGCSDLTPTQCKVLGFTFHRRVKREPRTLVGTVQLGGAGTCGVICVSSEYVGVQFVMTELLDGEDGA